jgi:hypothetical protein
MIPFNSADHQNKFVQFIRNAVANVFDADTLDCAAKIYFYPFSGVVFNQDEWNGFILPDEITVKTDKVPWVIEEGGKRLAAIVKDMNLPADTHLTVIVYGLTVEVNTPKGKKPGSVDLLYLVNENGGLTIETPSIYKNYV